MAGRQNRDDNNTVRIGCQQDRVETQRIRTVLYQGNASYWGDLLFRQESGKLPVRPTSKRRANSIEILRS